jgi:hypothetical protein
MEGETCDDITIITCYFVTECGRAGYLCTAEKYPAYMSRHSLYLCQRSSYVTCLDSLYLR